MNSPLVGIQYFIFEILGLQIRESFFYCYCNNFRDSVSFHIDLTDSGFLCCDLSCAGYGCDLVVGASSRHNMQSPHFPSDFI